MKLHKIEIDWDIHKLIEQERRGFDESPYLALRRLLKLPDAATPKNEIGSEDETGIPWMEDNVVVPHGSLARMEYDRGNQVYEGKFLNGKLVVNGEEFDTLSGAASAVAVTRAGTKTSLNGWLYWQVKFTGDSEWRYLSALR